MTSTSIPPGRPSSFTGMDLNLLAVFDSLMETRSVSRTAERIGLSQPAVSNALRRLRLLLDDDLLVRRGSGMEPTLRARALHPEISEALQGIRGALWGEDRFDPSTARRTFRMAMTDSISHQILPGLLRDLQAEAPGISVNISNGGMQDGVDRIASGELDVVVGVYMDTPVGVRSKVLASKRRLLVVASRSNPMLKDDRLDLAAYLAAPHVVVDVNRDGGATIDLAAAVLGLDRKIVAVVPHFTLVPAVVRGTDMVGPSTPELVGRLAYRDELVLFPPPLPTPSYNLLALWRRSANRDAALTWFRSKIDAVAARDVHWKMEQDAW